MLYTNIVDKNRPTTIPTAVWNILKPITSPRLKEVSLSGLGFDIAIPPAALIPDGTERRIPVTVTGKADFLNIFEYAFPRKPTVKEDTELMISERSGVNIVVATLEAYPEQLIRTPIHISFDLQSALLYIDNKAAKTGAQMRR